MTHSNVIMFRWVKERDKSDGAADGNLVTLKLKPLYLVCDISNKATNDGSGSKKRPVTFRCIIYIGGDRAGYEGGSLL